MEGKEPLPVSYWCYKLTKKFLWIGTIGTVSDFSMETVKKFNKKYPDLEIKNGDPSKIIYNTEFGKLIRIFHSILKDPHYKVMQYVNILE